MQDGVLLVGHGSRSEAGREEMLELCSLVEASRDIPVEAGFLELSDPHAGHALDHLVARGARRIAVVPLMLNAAGHAKSDVPAVVVEGRRRHPEVSLSYARALGVEHATLGVAHRRIMAVGGGGLPLLVVARGTTEPEANADATRVGRLLAEASGAPFVVTGFSGLTWPLVPDALDQCRQLGAQRIVLFAWYLCTGILHDRILDDARDWSGRTEIPILDAGHLGADPALVPLVWARAEEALAGDVKMSCDVCSYRAPFPGLEARVHQPIGVGHSHLAADHRHPHED